MVQFLSHSFSSTLTTIDSKTNKQNSRAAMAPHEAPAVAVKEQQQRTRLSSGSELTKENATAGIISNESLTVWIDDGCGTHCIAPFSFSIFLSHHLLLIKI